MAAGVCRKMYLKDSHVVMLGPEEYAMLCGNKEFRLVNIMVVDQLTLK